MAKFIDIQADFSEIDNYLKTLEKGSRTIRRYVLRNIGRITKNKIKKSYNVYLHKQSGDLYKSIKSTLSRRKDYDIVSANAENEKNIRYGYVLASGAEIRAKKKKYLTFKIDDKWIKKQSVMIPSKNFMEEPAEKYLKSTEMQMDMDYYLDKKLKDMEKKGTLKTQNIFGHGGS